MIPESIIPSDLEIEESTETSKTYKLSDTSIQGFTDEIGALRQAICKVLNTEKYEHSIYSFDYGIELENLIGQDQYYVKIELKRRIQECLLEDERITSVENFACVVNGESMLCTFDVISIYGDITISKEVIA